MHTSSYRRFTQKTVTCFLHYGDHYLFIHRTKKTGTVDAGKLNGIGGKVEPGENYLQCAIRETLEETGYVVKEQDCHFSGLINMSGGYSDDWVMGFFAITVPSMTIPSGNENEEGQLIWLHKDELLTSGYNLVDDLNYCWQDICQEKLFFAGAVVDHHEKIEQWNVSYLASDKILTN